MTARRLRAFVSSRMQELLEERAAVAAALTELHVDSFVFEHDAGARSQSIQATYLDEVAASDLYVGIFWKGYGAYTIEEFEEARLLGMDCLLYEKRTALDEGRDAALQSFLDRIGRVEDGLTARWFHDCEELATGIKRDVAAWQAEAIKRGRDAPPALWIGVPPVPSGFVGRHPELVQWVRHLRDGQSLALEGPAGVGKSSLAIMLARHPGVRRAFPDGVLWGSLGPAGDPGRSLDTWARALGVDLQGIDAARSAQAIRDAVGTRRVLLVIDDAWNEQDVEQLLCGGAHCCYLLTSRDKALARSVVGAANAHALDSMDGAQSWQLIETLAPEACTAAPDAVRALVAATGGLPLALQLIGTYLAAPERTMFADLFPELSAQALAELTDPSERLRLAQRHVGSGHMLSLAETFALSVNSLPAETRAAFFAMGAFAPKPAGFDVAAAATVALAQPAQIALLAARNLLEADPTRHRLAMHQAIADYARQQCPESAHERHRAHYLALLEAAGEDWRAIEAIYDQLREAWLQGPAVPGSKRHWQALERYWRTRGLWRDPLTWYRRLLDQLDSEEGPDKEFLQAIIHRYLAQLHSRIGEHHVAEQHYQAALERLSRCQAGDAPREEVETLLMAGVHARRVGRTRDAEDRLQRALEISRREALSNQQADALLAIAHLARYNNEPRRALVVLEELLAMESIKGNDAVLADALSVMGMTHTLLEDFGRAWDCLQRAAALWHQLGNPVGELEVRKGMSQVLEATGRHDEAIATLERALPLWAQTGDRLGTAETLRDIAHLYRESGQFDQALERYAESLAIAREIGQQELQAIVLDWMSITHERRGNDADAVTTARAALAVWHALGDANAEASTRMRLGHRLHALEQWPEALEAFEEAATVFRAPVASHSDEERQQRERRLAGAMFGQAIVLASLGRREDARAIAARVVDLRRKLGDLHQQSEEVLDFLKALGVEVPLDAGPGA